jgi:hypothetical protein
MTDIDRTVLTCEAPPVAVSAFAQMLREQGLTVDYTPPTETRSMPTTIAEMVVVNLTVTGTTAALKTGVSAAKKRFRASRFGAFGNVTGKHRDDR